MIDFRERISKTGLKINFIAELIGMDKTSLSQSLSEDRTLSMVRIQKLTKIIEHYEKSLQEIKERL